MRTSRNVTATPPRSDVLPRRVRKFGQTARPRDLRGDRVYEPYGIGTRVEGHAEPGSNRRGVPRTFAVFSPLRQLRTAAPRRNERRLPGRLEPEIPAQRRIGDPETVASLRPKLAKRSIFLERR